MQHRSHTKNFYALSSCTRPRLSSLLTCALCAPLLSSLPIPALAHAGDAGAQLFASAKFNQAHTAYAAAVKREPGNIPLRIDLTRTSLRLDNWKDAVNEAQGAVTVAPQNADAHGILGLALMRAGRPQKALAEADKSLALNSKDYWGLIARARVLMFNEQPGAAHEALAKANAQYPDRPDALYYLLASFEAKADSAQTDEQKAVNEKALRAEFEKAYKAYVKTNPKGHPHDRVIDSIARDVAPRNPFADKKNGPVFEAVGKIDEKRLKAADAGKEKPVTILIPFERSKQDNQTIILPLSINGVSLRLLFDTGAGHAISVAGPSAERLNLPKLYKSYARGVSGKEEIQISRADEMKVGTQVFKNIPVETTPNAIMPDIDGLIGGAVFEEYAVTIDYDNDNLILSRGKDAAAPKVQEGNHITTVPFHNMGGYIIVPLKLEDRAEPEWGLLDTGAGGMGVLAYSVAHDLAKKRQEDETAEVHVDRRLGIGTSSTGFDAMVFRFSVDLGLVNNGGTPFFMELSPIYGATMIDKEVNRSFDFHLSAIVGISYVAEAKRTTFDYPHHLMTMEFGPKAAN